jgi:poly(hydroxyalkanoate) granule-associated protein
MVRKQKPVAGDEAAQARESAEPAASSAASAKPKASLFDLALADQVRDSAQQIWLAGMGAFAKAQAEGRQVFETLVKDGTSLQEKTQATARERLDDVTGKVSSAAGDVTARAGQQWDKLESIFEERTAKALNRLGVPSAKDVQALAARIDALNAKVEALSAELANRAPASRPVAQPTTTGNEAAVKRPARKTT